MDHPPAGDGTGPLPSQSAGMGASTIADFSDDAPNPTVAHAARIAREIAALKPLLGTPAFWAYVEGSGQLLCETLLHWAWKLEQCMPADARRLEEIVVRRVQGRIHIWACHINQTKMHGHLTEQQREELEEECLVRMITEWREHKPGWLHFFATALSFCQQHTLETWAIKEGYWSRATERAQRVPRRFLTSLDALSVGDEERADMPGTRDIADPRAAEALEHADYLDLLPLLAQLDPPLKLAVTLDIQEMPRQEIGRILGISQVTLRKWLQQAYADLAARYQ
jgi:hypothetical protein